MKIRVNTTEYIWSHGRKPRGSGRWAFQVGENSTNQFFFYGTYTQALKEAMKVARECKIDTVKVLP